MVATSAEMRAPNWDSELGIAARSSFLHVYFVAVSFIKFKKFWDKSPAVPLLGQKPKKGFMALENL